ncbi:hypothetical protein COF68_05975 [Bacillus toyonensis]|uniref:competence protein CoiA family protein n=1 Tax=Bacillus toyonensis TaxID=155322 RepID=UPI000BFD3D54|nr:competence protein CoiA family protein [Bacillus toyonensis]PHE64383.1 hypothetical protein COF68_05975 [Bacillus toyonensis]
MYSEEVKFYYALNSTDTIVSIEDVPIENKDRDTYRCPECNEYFIPRVKGTKRTRHFAHKPDSNCTSTNESILHFNSKNFLTKTINSLGDLNLNCPVELFGNKLETIYKSLGIKTQPISLRELLNFYSKDYAYSEFYIGNYKADVLVDKGEYEAGFSKYEPHKFKKIDLSDVNLPFVFEVLVTSDIDDIKMEFLNKWGIPYLEVTPVIVPKKLKYEFNIVRCNIDEFIKSKTNSIQQEFFILSYDSFKPEIDEIAKIEYAKEIEGSIRKEVKLEVEEKVTREIIEVSEESLKHEIRRELYPLIKQEIKKEYAEEIRESVKKQVRLEIEEKVTKEIIEEKIDIIRIKLTRELRPLIEQEVRDKYAKGIEAKVSRDIRKDLDKRYIEGKLDYLEADSRTAIVNELRERYESINFRQYIDKDSFREINSIPCLGSRTDGTRKDILFNVMESDSKLVINREWELIDPIGILKSILKSMMNNYTVEVMYSNKRNDSQFKGDAIGFNFRLPNKERTGEELKKINDNILKRIVEYIQGEEKIRLEIFGTYSDNRLKEWVDNCIINRNEIPSVLKMYRKDTNKVYGGHKPYPL